MIQLYATMSPNVSKVTIALEELGLDYELRHVDVFAGAQFAPAFQALNPLGRVPVLVDPAAPDGEPLFESGAILLYLAERYGRPDLLPAAGGARYAVLKWLMFQMGSVGPMFGQHNHFIIMPDQHGGYAAERYRDQAFHLYTILDTRLAASPWLAGDAYSIADIATYPWALYVEKHGFDWADFPALGAWRDRCEARPAVARAAARMADFVAATPASSRPPVRGTFDRLFWRRAAGPETDLTPMMPKD